MTQTLMLEGQKIVYNPDSHLVKTTIKEPFFAASKILKWEKHSPGLGINQKIIDFVLKTKSRLIIHVESAGHDYWQSWDKIQQIIKTTNTPYKTGNTWLCVLPWREFVGYEHRVEA